MKLRVVINGESYTLEMERAEASSQFSLQGAHTEAGSAWIAEISPGIFSVLIGHKSVTVSLASKEGVIEAMANGHQYLLLISDARDRSAATKKAGAVGPAEIRAQMPGKVIKLLVGAGAAVAAGQGVIVVEAMKMQNEMRSPKAGVVSRIHVEEGATVAAGQTMMVVE